MHASLLLLVVELALSAAVMAVRSLNLLLAIALLSATCRYIAATHTAYGKASLKRIKQRCNVTGTFSSNYYAGGDGDGRVIECMTYCFDTINLEHNPFMMHVKSREGKFYEAEAKGVTLGDLVPGVSEKSDVDKIDRYEVRGYKADVSGERDKIGEKVLLNNGKEVCHW